MTDRITLNESHVDEIDLDATHVSIERMSWHDWDIHVYGADGRHMHLYARDIGIHEDAYQADRVHKPDLHQCPVTWGAGNVHDGHRCDYSPNSGHRRHRCECGDYAPSKGKR